MAIRKRRKRRRIQKVFGDDYSSESVVLDIINVTRTNMLRVGINIENNNFF